jgi:hypothetical protein
MAVSPSLMELDWFPCNTPLCQGRITLLVTDMDGFVIQPNHKRGNYVYVRKEVENATKGQPKTKRTA